MMQTSIVAASYVEPRHSTRTSVAPNDNIVKASRWLNLGN